MWNNVTIPIRDSGLEGARRYLVAKGITNATCVFHNGRFDQLEMETSPFTLYILAHGCSDRAAMASGPFIQTAPGKPWGASKLARELILRNFPGNRLARIKLCLCHSAERIREPVKVENESIFEFKVFAQQLAMELYKYGNPPRAARYVGHPPHTFAHVYVGGFPMPVNWAAEPDLPKLPKPVPKPKKLNLLDDNERASRLYYRCSPLGELCDKLAMPANAITRETRYCYFPFDFTDDPGRYSRWG